MTRPLDEENRKGLGFTRTTSRLCEPATEAELNQLFLDTNWADKLPTFAENEERSPFEPLHVQRGYRAEQSVVTVFTGMRHMAFTLGLRQAHWRDHVRNMLRGMDPNESPTLLLDPIAARLFQDVGGLRTKQELIDWVCENARMPAGEYWDYQLVQNYLYPRATFGEEPLASKLRAAPDALIPMWTADQINVVVVGGETNGYWRIAGSRLAGSACVDEWR